MTEELEKKLQACKTEEEAQKLLEESKSELSDEELNQLNGGMGKIQWLLSKNHPGIEVCK